MEGKSACQRFGRANAAGSRGGTAGRPVDPSLNTLTAAAARRVTTGYCRILAVVALSLRRYRYRRRPKRAAMAVGVKVRPFLRLIRTPAVAEGEPSGRANTRLCRRP